MRAAIAAAAAAAALACTAAPAHATRVAYVDGHNVVVSATDGTGKSILTTDGTAAEPYGAPVRLADGRTAAVRGKQYFVWDRSGRLERTVSPALSSTMTGLTDLAVDATGAFVALSWQAPPSFERVSVGHLDGRAFPAEHQASRAAAFAGTQVVGTHGNGDVWITLKSLVDGPLETRSVTWIDPHPSFSFREAVPDPGQTRLFADIFNHDVGDSALGFYTAAPGAQPQGLCELRTAARPMAPAWSPDGKLIAWSDAEGAKVAGAPTGADAEGWCVLSSPATVVSATGSAPSLGGDPPAPAPPGPTSPGPTTPGPQQRPASASLAVKAAKLTTVLKRGLRVTIKGARDGRVKLTAKLKGKRVASGKTTVTRGTATVTLRFTKSAKRKLKRAKRATLVITGGGARTTVTLRR
jgi:hypothetical protein